LILPEFLSRGSSYPDERVIKNVILDGSIGDTFYFDFPTELGLSITSTMKQPPFRTAMTGIIVGKVASVLIVVGLFLDFPVKDY
jgi:hypothetical protein